MLRPLFPPFISRAALHPVLYRNLPASLSTTPRTSHFLRTFPVYTRARVYNSKGGGRRRTQFTAVATLSPTPPSSPPCRQDFSLLFHRREIDSSFGEGDSVYRKARFGRREDEEVEEEGEEEGEAKVDYRAEGGGGAWAEAKKSRSFDVKWNPRGGVSPGSPRPRGLLPARFSNCSAPPLLLSTGAGCRLISTRFRSVTV